MSAERNETSNSSDSETSNSSDSDTPLLQPAQKPLASAQKPLASAQKSLRGVMVKSSKPSEMEKQLEKQCTCEASRYVSAAAAAAAATADEPPCTCKQGKIITGESASAEALMEDSEELLVSEDYPVCNEKYYSNNEFICVDDYLNLHISICEWNGTEECPIKIKQFPLKVDIRSLNSDERNIMNHPVIYHLVNKDNTSDPIKNKIQKALSFYNSDPHKYAGVRDFSVIVRTIDAVIGAGAGVGGANYGVVYNDINTLMKVLKTMDKRDNVLQPSINDLFVFHYFIHRPWFATLRQALSTTDKFLGYAAYIKYFGSGGSIDFDVLGSSHEDDLAERASITTNKILSTPNINNIVTIDGHGRLITKIMQNLLISGQEERIENVNIIVTDVDFIGDLWHKLTLPKCCYSYYLPIINKEKPAGIFKILNDCILNEYKDTDFSMLPMKKKINGDPNDDPDDDPDDCVIAYTGRKDFLTIGSKKNIKTSTDTYLTYPEIEKKKKSKTGGAASSDKLSTVMGLVSKQTVKAGAGRYEVTETTNELTLNKYNENCMSIISKIKTDNTFFYANLSGLMNQNSIIFDLYRKLSMIDKADIFIFSMYIERNATIPALMLLHYINKFYNHKQKNLCEYDSDSKYVTNIRNAVINDPKKYNKYGADRVVDFFKKKTLNYNFNTELTELLLESLPESLPELLSESQKRKSPLGGGLKYLKYKTKYLALKKLLGL